MCERHGLELLGAALRPAMEVEDPEVLLGDDAVALDLGESIQGPPLPHPSRIDPPPPEEEPPRLLRNKRPFGLEAVETQLLSPMPLRPALGVAALDDTLNSSSSSQDDNGPGLQEGSDEEEQVDLVDIQLDIDRPAPPKTPPGPPPAFISPPPPAGPPPSLPLDRAELKRTREPALGGGKRQRREPPPDVEASYAESPASARWVWDRCLLAESGAPVAAQSNPAATAILERRLLLALNDWQCAEGADPAEASSSSSSTGNSEEECATQSARKADASNPQDCESAKD